MEGSQKIYPVRAGRTVRIGVRPSRLALKQAEEAAALLSAGAREFRVRTFDTSGDRDKITPITETEGSDFFTDSIEKALMEGEIDIAVHSAKDLPDKIPSGLIVAAITDSIDPCDALVSKGNLKLDELPEGARVGTSSVRRKEQLRKYRRDLRLGNIRGNIEERLKQLDEGGFDAIVIAAAGLIRLGLAGRISQKLPFEIIAPHPLQGRLAFETRSDDREMMNLVEDALEK